MSPCEIEAIKTRAAERNSLSIDQIIKGRRQLELDRDALLAALDVAERYIEFLTRPAKDVGEIVARCREYLEDEDLTLEDAAEMAQTLTNVVLRVASERDRRARELDTERDKVSLLRAALFQARSACVGSKAPDVEHIWRTSTLALQATRGDAGV